MLKDIATGGEYVDYNDTTYRVLYNSSEEGLQIILNEPTTQVALGGSSWEEGRTGYNNAIETLNEATKDYKGIYGIDYRCVGSIPQVDENGYFSLKDTQGELTNFYFNLNIDGSDEMRKSDSNYSSSKEVRDLETMRKKDVLKCNKLYWLASRTITSTYDPDGDRFNVRYVTPNGDVMGHMNINPHFCSIFKNGTAGGGGIRSFYLRPVISLELDVKVLSGNGTIDNHYIIGK